MNKTLTVLGAGYTARFLLPLASRQYTHAFATSRMPDTHLGSISMDRHIVFDLERPDTWPNIPDEADLLWCFPAAPIESVRQFAAAAKASSRRLVVLGSTSAYDVGAPHDYPPPWIDETTPIDVSKPRVQGEEYLRLHCGAVVLRVAGIYGPGRNPLDWITTDRVAPSRKYVNLIHVEDLAAICLTALEQGRPGETYNVSDGTPRTWDEICRFAQQRWGMVFRASAAHDGAGKRISNTKLLSMLGTAHDGLHHSNLFSALTQIQKTMPKH